MSVSNGGKVVAGLFIVLAMTVLWIATGIALWDFMTSAHAWLREKLFGVAIWLAGTGYFVGFLAESGE